MTKAVTTQGIWSRELVKAIAMDIGKSTADYIEHMYPEAVQHTASTFKTSVKHHIYNDLMAALEVTDEAAIRERLKVRRRHRLKMIRFWRAHRRSNPSG